MLCKATYIKKANLIKVTSNEVGYLLKPVLGLELDHLRGMGIENRVICRAIGLQFVVISNRTHRLNNQFCQTPYPNCCNLIAKSTSIYWASP